MRAIVFDLDGTLVDSAPDIAWGINRMLADHGMAPLPVRDVERLTGEGTQALVAKVYAGLAVDVDADRLARDADRYLAYYRARPCVDSTLFADAATALPALRQAGLALGICTNKPEALAVLVLRELGILSMMGVVGGADTTAARKPDPLPLLHALDALGVAAGEALYVGDMAIDWQCASAAGVSCRMVGWGSAAADHPASVRLARFAELLPAGAAP